MNNKETIFIESGLLEHYALDLCNPVEMMEVEQMLKSSPSVRKKYEELQDNLEKLARTRAVHPPEEVRSRILDFLNEESEAPIVDMKDPFQPGSDASVEKNKSGSLLKLAAGLALLLTLGLLYQQHESKKSLLAEKNLLEDELEKLQGDLEDVRVQMASIQSEYSFINDGATQKIILSKPEENKLQLVAYWNKEEGKAMLDVSKMPTPPSGKCYQLWADVHGEMLSVAVIIDMDASPMKAVQYFEDAESLNITLEDSPGSDHATVSALVTSANV